MRQLELQRSEGGEDGSRNRKTHLTRLLEVQRGVGFMKTGGCPRLEDSAFWLAIPLGPLIITCIF